MSKKIVGTVLGVASFALMAVPGIGQIVGLGLRAAQLIGVGLSVASNVLLGPAKPKALSTSPHSRLFAALDVTTPRKMAFGDGAAPTVAIYL